MSRDDRARLHDIIEALEAIRDSVGGNLTEPTIDGPVVVDAILFRLIVIGEAVKHVSAELLDDAAHIRWSDIAGLRDVIAHEYFRIQRQIIEAIELINDTKPAIDAGFVSSAWGTRIAGPNTGGRQTNTTHNRPRPTPLGADRPRRHAIHRLSGTPITSQTTQAPAIDPVSPAASAPRRQSWAARYPTRTDAPEFVVELVCNESATGRSSSVTPCNDPA